MLQGARTRQRRTACECCFERQFKMMNKIEKACLARPQAGCLGVRRVRDGLA